VYSFRLQRVLPGQAPAFGEARFKTTFIMATTNPIKLSHVGSTNLARVDGQGN
jgi:hypothetical protein